MNPDDAVVRLDGLSVDQVLGRTPRALNGALYLLAALLLGSILFAWLCRVDVVVSARGIVRPSADLVDVEAPAAGRLIEATVDVGRTVCAGEVLFRIDDVDERGAIERQRMQLGIAERELEAERSARAELLAQHFDERRRDAIALQVAEDEVGRSRSEAAEKRIALDTARARLAEVRAAFERAERLVGQGVLTRAELESAKALSATAEGATRLAEIELAAAEEAAPTADRRVELVRSDAAISERARTIAVAALDSRIRSSEHDQRVAQHELEQLRAAIDRRTVRAPLHGTVTAVRCSRPGEFVTPGTLLARIAPAGDAWIVRAVIANRDAGVARSCIGGRVRLKFDAFPYLDHGVIAGTLLAVAPDASSEDGERPAFVAEIGLDSNEVGDSGRICLGMTVSTEIVHGRERLLLLLFRGLRDRLRPRSPESPPLGAADLHSGSPTTKARLRCIACAMSRPTFEAIHVNGSIRPGSCT